MDDEKDTSGIRCDVCLIVEAPKPGKELSQSLAVRRSVWCAYAKTADRSWTRITAG
jgi:hypothetical protein